MGAGPDYKHCTSIEISWVAQVSISELSSRILVVEDDSHCLKVLEEAFLPRVKSYIKESAGFWLCL